MRRTLCTHLQFAVRFYPKKKHTRWYIKIDGHVWSTQPATTQTNWNSKLMNFNSKQHLPLFVLQLKLKHAVRLAGTFSKIHSLSVCVFAWHCPGHQNQNQCNNISIFIWLQAWALHKIMRNKQQEKLSKLIKNYVTKLHNFPNVKLKIGFLPRKIIINWFNFEYQFANKMRLRRA